MSAGGVTSRIAICSDCGWRYESQNINTHAKSRYHAFKKKHLVSVEIARIAVYNGHKQEKSSV